MHQVMWVKNLIELISHNESLYNIKLRIELSIFCKKRALRDCINIFVFCCNLECCSMSRGCGVQEGVVRACYGTKLSFLLPGWQISFGIGGRNKTEQAAPMNRAGWQEWSGKCICRVREITNTDFMSRSD